MRACLRRAPGNSLVRGSIQVQRPGIRVERTGRVSAVARCRVDTHADKDLYAGFTDLLDVVTIGELWATRRLWREFEEADGGSLCDDAKAFHEEVLRRVEATKKAVDSGNARLSGDRVLITGYDADGGSYSYHDPPDECITGPGHTPAEGVRVGRGLGFSQPGSHEASTSRTGRHRMALVGCLVRRLSLAGCEDSSTRIPVCDDRLPVPTADFVSADRVRGYPTNFKVVPTQHLLALTSRGEQLTRALLGQYCRELVS